MNNYTNAEIDAAFSRVEVAKQNHPVGWEMLDELGLGPSDQMVAYAFANADTHLYRLVQEKDPRVVYATGWLQGLAVGQSLRKEGE